MKVLAVNGSPRCERGNTAMMLAAFLEGVQEAGAEVETIYTQRMDIRPCLGDVSCWFVHQGDCCQHDDMQALYPKIRAADVWVLATPLYFWGMTGPMKNLVDRMMPLGGPRWERHDGRILTTGPRPPVAGKVVLVSTGGMWSLKVFDALVAHVREIAAGCGCEFAGALLRPQINVFRPMLEGGAPVGDVLDAAREAGRQLVRQGCISTATLQTVSRELLPEDAYVETVNAAFAQILASR